MRTAKEFCSTFDAILSSFIILSLKLTYLPGTNDRQHYIFSHEYVSWRDWLDMSCDHGISQDFEIGCPKWPKIPHSTKSGYPLRIHSIIKIWILGFSNWKQGVLKASGQYTPLANALVVMKMFELRLWSMNYINNNNNCFEMVKNMNCRELCCFHKNIIFLGFADCLLFINSFITIQYVFCRKYYFNVVNEQSFQKYVFEENAKVCYNLRIAFSCVSSVDQQILPTMHHDLE